ncbi:polyadenylate binding domain-containing protein [Planctomicrobium piriforme]|uniref:Tetratricopeptide repeat-containing protein n=1 Tax=Planctomicrobium piriforme TaxID=1576369 RepID=A0A1I3C2V6_9PLAN|nr:hypothetical protein [Planctomicrobium piriforme]SFH68938.1 hypothetical protein SAMN05421753_10273 [Planctomicrobium piriforme]
MKLRRMYASAVVACLASSSAFAQSFPTVIGSTGKPYGPTQAEYQYQLQYGRPSPGSNGSGLQFVNGYPGGGGGGGGGHGGWNGGGGNWNHGGNWGGWGPQIYMGFDPFNYPQQGYIYYPSTASYNNFYNYNYGAPAGGLVADLTPSTLLPLPGNGLPNGLPTSGIFQGNYSAGQNPFASVQPAAPPVAPSTPDEQQKSMQFQTQGDIQFQFLNYLAASERYRKSIDAARDRADPRYRIALTLAGRSRFMEAVDQLKLSVAIDPTFPQHGDSLDQVFGTINTFEKTRVKQRVAEWTLQDPRDPNRLFLLGALLYMDGDPKSQTILNTAVAVSGRQEHLLAFMAPRTTPIPATDTDLNPKPVQPQPPHPQPPMGMQRPMNPPVPANPVLPTPAQQPPMQQHPIPAVPPMPESREIPQLPGNAQPSPLPAFGESETSGPALPPPP